MCLPPARQERAIAYRFVQVGLNPFGSERLALIRRKPHSPWIDIVPPTATALAPQCHREFAFGICRMGTGVMFLILAWFCYHFLVRSWGKGHIGAHVRAGIYGLCGATITVAIVILTLDHLLGRLPVQHLQLPYDLIFWGETAGLLAFGVSWLLASHVLPVLVLPNKQHKPWVNSPATVAEAPATTHPENTLTTSATHNAPS